MSARTHFYMDLNYSDVSIFFVWCIYDLDKINCLMCDYFLIHKRTFYILSLVSNNSRLMMVILKFNSDHPKTKAPKDDNVIKCQKLNLVNTIY